MEAKLTDTNFFRYYNEKAGLTAEELNILKPYFSFKKYDIEKFILSEGEHFQHIIFVESGLLISYLLSDNGKEHILQFAPENWIISDRSTIYFGEPSTYFIKTIEPAVVVLIDPLFMEKASEINHEFRCFVDTSLQRNIHMQQQRIGSLLALSAKERYVSFIKKYPQLILRVPQWMIASYLGITPESLSRVRRVIMKESG